MKNVMPKIDTKDGLFHNGNPATGEQGTRVTDSWLNGVQGTLLDLQAEAHYVLTKAGFNPIENKQTQLYEAIAKFIADSTRSTSDTGLDSETLLLTAKGGKKLSQQIAQLQQNVTQNYILNSKKSNAVNSGSKDTVATSAAVKTAYDKGVEAKSAADNAQRTADSKWTAQPATENRAGILPISHKTDGTAKDKFASEFAVGEAAKKGLPVGAIVSFPRVVTHPAGFLRADGTTFNAQTFPDLYRTLGNKNTLPDLTRSDVGMTAYFAVGNVPAGWIYFDDIATQVTQQRYPELYRHLVAKYGSIESVPKAEDRFIRNAGNGLNVGQVQGDAIRNIKGDFTVDTYKDYKNDPIFIREHLGGAFYTDFDKDFRSKFGPGNNGDSQILHFDASRVVPTADENRPKSLVLKLCIKAQNTFDDVVFWIKSHGEVANAGVLDASHLAQDLQDKADLNHTHTIDQITDLDRTMDRLLQAISGTYQKIGNFEIRKYPDGTMIQTYVITQQDMGVKRQEQSFNWAVAFNDTPLIFTETFSSYNGSHDCGVTFRMKSTNTTCYYWEYEHREVNQGNVRIQFLAIGRWKEPTTLPHVDEEVML